MISVSRVLDLRRDPIWVKMKVERGMSDVHTPSFGVYV